METKACILLSYLFTIFLIFASLAAVFPKVYEHYKERQIIIENDKALIDIWSSKPLLQQYKFYFFNITNIGEIRDSKSSLVFKEIGPFTYNLKQQNDYDYQNKLDTVRYMNYDELEFSLNESVLDESISIYFLNVTLVNSLCSSTNVTKYIRKGIVYKTRIKDILREIISLQVPKPTASKSNEQDNLDTTIASENINYDLLNMEIDQTMDYETKKFALCSKMFEIAPIFSSSWCNYELKDEGTLCDCMILTEKGKELVKRTYPINFEIPTNKFVLLWDKESCSIENTRTDLTFHNGISLTDLSGVLMDSFHLETNVQVRNNSAMEIKTSEYSLYFNIENTTKIVTDFILQFQLNIEMKTIFGNSTNTSTLDEVYPVLRSKIIGKSGHETDYFLYYYIIYPSIFIKKILPRILFFVVCFFIACSIVTCVLIHRGTDDDIKDFSEKTPLLKREFQPYSSLIQNNA